MWGMEILPATGRRAIRFDGVSSECSHTLTCINVFRYYYYDAFFFFFLIRAPYEFCSGKKKKQKAVP